MVQEKTSKYRRGTAKVTTPNLKTFYEFNSFVDVILGFNVRRVVAVLELNFGVQIREHSMLFQYSVNATKILAFKGLVSWFQWLVAQCSTFRI
jgi:hypothetical protein